MPSGPHWHEGKGRGAPRMSLDGFIAGPGHEMDWVFEHTAPGEGAEEAMAATGAMLSGRHTYDVGQRSRRPETSAAYGGAWSGAEFVLTHRARRRTTTRPPSSCRATWRRRWRSGSRRRTAGTSRSSARTSPCSASPGAWSTRSTCTSSPSCWAPACRSRHRGDGAGRPRAGRLGELRDPDEPALSRPPLTRGAASPSGQVMTEHGEEGSGRIALERTSKPPAAAPIGVPTSRSDPTWTGGARRHGAASWDVSCWVLYHWDFDRGTAVTRARRTGSRTGSGEIGYGF